MVEAKHTGSWLQEAIDGDISEWLKAEGVSFINRQAMWAAGYGNGASMQHALLHEGVLYQLPMEKDSKEETQATRSAHRLDGVARPSIEADGVPILPIRMYNVAGKLQGEVVELTSFDKDGKVNSTTRRSVSGDGTKMTEEVMYTPHNAKPFSVKLTYKRLDMANPLTAETCLPWRPGGLTLGAATSPKAAHKQVVFLGPLEEFPSVADFMDCFDKALRQSEAGSTVTEISDSKFQVTSSTKEVYEFQADREAGEVAMSVAMDGKPLGASFLKVHAGPPLRVECWSNEADEAEATIGAMESLLHVADAVMLYKMALSSS